MTDSDCIFCQILAGERPASIVYQDERCTAFMDIRPVNPGHMLVIPNYHADNMADLDENTAGHMFQVGKRLDQALRGSGLKCEGVNLFLADGRSAGQEVMHTHLHVLPRYQGDGFGFRFGPSYMRSATRSELDAISQKVHSAMKIETRPNESSTEPQHPNVHQQIRRRVTPELYQRIRREWMAHSIAEDRRDIPGLMATLAEDCAYVMPQFGQVWRGHEGATRFYTELLTAFPDIHFDLQNIVIGPQGVCEEAHVTGTHKNRWLDQPATGERVEFDVIIFFPWNAEREKFAGERVYMFFPPDT